MLLVAAAAPNMNTLAAHVYSCELQAWYSATAEPNTFCTCRNASKPTLRISHKARHPYQLAWVHALCTMYWALDAV